VAIFFFHRYKNPSEGKANALGPTILWICLGDSSVFGYPLGHFLRVKVYVTLVRVCRFPPEFPSLRRDEPIFDASVRGLG